MDRMCSAQSYPNGQCQARPNACHPCRLPLLPMRSILLPFALLSTLFALAQPEKPDLVQFSGVVVTDSLSPVPFTNILVKNTYRGTMSDVYGYFSFVAQEGDTILFSAIGFQRSQYQIPKEMAENKYSMIHVMTRDTCLLYTSPSPRD